MSGRVDVGSTAEGWGPPGTARRVAPDPASADVRRTAAAATAPRQIVDVTADDRPRGRRDEMSYVREVNVLARRIR